jgi:DnaJ-class molecular chaperone
MIQGLDLYQLLGVAPSCSPEELTKGYRQMCLKWHPDKNVDKVAAKEHFQKICEAYAVLSDPVRRKRYDQTGDTGDGQDLDCGF